MKSKIKKFIKRCTIFLTVFVICFSCFSFPSAALGDNSNGLFIDYYVKPVLQYQVGSSWVDVSDYDSHIFYQSADGSIDKMIYSWTGLYGILQSDVTYRLTFRFYLMGNEAKQYSLSFNGYFSSAINRDDEDKPSEFISLTNLSAYSQLTGDGTSASIKAVDSSLGSRVGYNFVFNSFDEQVKKFPDKNYTGMRNSVLISFKSSEELTDLHFVLDNFSTDLFFSAPSNDEFQDYDNAEQQILDSTTEGRSQASALFGAFGSLSTSVATPIISAGKIVSKFFNEIPILNDLFTFSLSLGIFSFLVGMAVAIGGHISAKTSRNEARSLNADKRAYYRSGTAYYNSRTKK